FDNRPLGRRQRILRRDTGLQQNASKGQNESPHDTIMFGLAVLTFRFRYTRPSCFQNRLTWSSCDTTNAATRSTTPTQRSADRCRMPKLSLSTTGQDADDWARPTASYAITGAAALSTISAPKPSVRRSAVSTSAPSTAARPATTSAASTR